MHDASLADLQLVESLDPDVRAAIERVYRDRMDEAYNRGWRDALDAAAVEEVRHAA